MLSAKGSATPIEVRVSAARRLSDSMPSRIFASRFRAHARQIAQFAFTSGGFKRINGGDVGVLPEHAWLSSVLRR